MVGGRHEAVQSHKEISTELLLRSKRGRYVASFEFPLITLSQDQQSFTGRLQVRLCGIDEKEDYWSDDIQVAKEILLIKNATPNLREGASTSSVKELLINQPYENKELIFQVKVKDISLKSVEGFDWTRIKHAEYFVFEDGTPPEKATSDFKTELKISPQQNKAGIQNRARLEFKFLSNSAKHKRPGRGSPSIIIVVSAGNGVAADSNESWPVKLATKIVPGEGKCERKVSAKLAEAEEHDAAALLPPKKKPKKNRSSPAPAAKSSKKPKPTTTNTKPTNTKRKKKNARQPAERPSKKGKPEGFDCCPSSPDASFSSPTSPLAMMRHPDDYYPSSPDCFSSCSFFPPPPPLFSSLLDSDSYESQLSDSSSSSVDSCSNTFHEWRFSSQ